MKRQLILGLFIVLPASLGGCGLGTNEFETLTGHTGNVLSVSWSEDGTKILRSSKDGSVRWWDLENGQHRVHQEQKPKYLQAFENNWANTVYGNRGGTMLAMISGSSVRIWDATSKASKAQWQVLSGYKSKVHCVSWSPDGTKLASGDLDCNVRVFDTTNGDELLRLKGHKAFHGSSLPFGPIGVQSVAWSPDGSLLARCGNDKFVRVWDVEKGIQDLVGVWGLRETRIRDPFTHATLSPPVCTRVVDT